MYEEPLDSEKRSETFSFLPNMSASDSWNKPYSSTETAWGIILLVGIFGINIAVLWVVGRSRELWKPRHLWMACLCVTDLFVGAHKGLELLLLILPQKELCVLHRATMGIPYVVNMLLLTLLSLDRFVAVRHPFFYSATVSNKHVGIGVIFVCIFGASLAAASITLGLKDRVCKTQNLQLICLTVVLAICSFLTLLFNSAVLRIAKRQLNAIYTQEPSFRGKRKVSVVCSNCGYKNETFVNALLPVDAGGQANGGVAGTANTILPLTDAVVLGPLDLEQVCEYHGCSPGALDLEHLVDPSVMDDTTTPLVKTVSLPAISDALMNVPISLVVQPDPAIHPAVVIGSVQTEVDIGQKMTSMSKLNETHPSDHNCNTQFQTMPRSRSLVTCQTHKIIPSTEAAAVPRLQLFRNLHFARTHMFHVGRLFPSIRFARTVLLIMIPMWVFILPIVTIIPLRRACEDGNKGDLNCDVVSVFSKYLVVHMRSILPLQAILDTLIYAFGSKEFRNALGKLVKRMRSRSPK